MIFFYLLCMEDEKERNIVPPDMDYRYFEDYGSYKFKYKSKKFEINNAWFLAEASLLAYCHPQFVRLVFAEAGIRNFRAFIGNNIAYAFVLDNGKFATVVFRGTELKGKNFFLGAMADLSFNFEPEGAGMVHSGFRSALDEIWEGENGLLAYLEVLRQLNPGMKFWFAGHSLGGAMATIAASRVNFCQGLYTFGSPRVGESRFKASVTCPAYRVVNKSDPITMMPPKKLGFLGFEEVYTHVGELKYISRSNMLLDDFDRKIEVPSVMKESFNQVMRVFRESVNVDIRDHAPVFYAEHLKQLRAVLH